MGCCCSCCSKGGSGTKESEMTSKQRRKAGMSMMISRKMSSPSITLEDDNLTIQGCGLALAGVSIEQDAAYWEWQMHIPKGSSVDVMFGVSTSKDRNFYKALDEATGEDAENSQTNGTSLMRKVPLKDEDTVGVAVQQSDLPMIQYLLNGEPMHELAINRFRGQVFPSIFLPAGEGIKATLVFDEDDFKQLPPNARFGPVIVARGLI